LAAANALGTLRAVVATTTATSNIAARSAERDRRVKVPGKSLALFVRLRQ
jgi:hypothetical protein